jgi:tetratricopeptide (TPR) repeat protein
MNRSLRSVLVALALAAAWSAAEAQSGASEASGSVVDLQGNPIAGATVKFVPQANPTLEYTGKTNKKGKYFVTGLWTPKEDDMWDLFVEAEGYVPAHVRIESRTVNRVLIGNTLDVALPPNAKAPAIMIRPLGSAQVDWKMGKEGEVAAAQAQPAAPAGPAVAEAKPGTEKAEKKEAPEDPWAEAVSLASQGNLAGSVPFFEKAIAAAPDDAERHEAFAKVLYQLDRHADAETPARRAVELAPTRLDAHMVLYTVYAGQESWDRAAEALASAAQIAPGDLRVLEQRAYVASRAGRPADAVAAYEEMTRVAPDRPDAWLALGGLYADQGDLKKSEAAYAKVTELDPSSAYQTFYNLGVLIANRTNRGETDTRRAVEAFRKAVEIKPDYAAAHKQLGLLLIETGDRPAAARALEQYLAHQPNAPDRSEMQALIAAMKK